jgi:hypothetical protein
MDRPFVDIGIDHGRALAQAIVDTIRQPLLVLDRNLCVVAASRSSIRRSRSAGRMSKVVPFTR